MVIDEEEFALIRDVKSKKKEYQKVFNDRKICQNELNYLKGLVSQTQVRLLSAFLLIHQCNLSTHLYVQYVVMIF